MLLGTFAFIYLGVAPGLIARFGPPTIFVIFAVVMAMGAVVAAFFFPSVPVKDAVVAGASRFSRSVWQVIIGIMLMSLVQAMVSSFLERAGADRGLSPQQVRSVLVIMGLIAIAPAPIAALLEKRLPATGVGIGGALVQGLFAALIYCSSGFLPYAAGTMIFPFIILFTHTFMFGRLARLEPTGRAVAATPAMVMAGSTIAPLLGGLLVQTFGYPALGVTALALNLIAFGLFAASRRAVSVVEPRAQASAAT